MIDSGLIDSHVHLGINTRPEQRFQYRSILHCSPLVTAGHTTLYNVSDHESYTLYHYGSMAETDLSNVTLRASMDFRCPAAEQTDL